MWFFPMILLICLHEAYGIHKYRGFKFMDLELDEGDTYVEGGSYVRPFKRFTLCQWTRQGADNRGVIFSYYHKDCSAFGDLDCIAVTITWDNALYVTIMGDHVSYRRNHGDSFTYARPLGKWLHTCICFSVAEGSYEYVLYVNGQREYGVESWNIRGTLFFRMRQDDVFPGGGKVFLGRRHDLRHPLRGTIANLNVWDKTLSPDEIKKVYHCQDYEPPLLINWNNRWSAINGAMSMSATVPCGCELD